MSKFPSYVLAVLVMLIVTTAAQAVTSNVRSITIANNRNDWFYIEELTAVVDGLDRASVFAGASETQNFTPAFGSSVIGAIDDALTGCCGTGVHSDAASINKSVTVTFNKQFDLSEIRLHGRTDGCCPERLNDVIVSYFDGPNGTGNLIASHNVVGAGGVNPFTGLSVITPDGAGTVDTGPFKVALTSPTSLKAQTGFGGLTPNKAIDTITNVQGGWGNGNPGGDFGPNIAVFETLEDLGGNGGSELTFQLNFSSFGDHGLGKFRLSATTDDRSAFADGLFQGGDVDANWVTLTPTSATASSGNVLNILPDDSILVTSLFDPTTDLYTINLKTSLTGITGFRIEALQDPSLPVNGPGLSNSNGNFVLTEFTVLAREINIPEPASAALGLMGVLALALRRRRAA